MLFFERVLIELILYFWYFIYLCDLSMDFYEKLRVFQCYTIVQRFFGIFIVIFTYSITDFLNYILFILYATSALFGCLFEQTNLRYYKSESFQIWHAYFCISDADRVGLQIDKLLLFIKICKY